MTMNHVFDSVEKKSTPKNLSMQHNQLEMTFPFRIKLLHFLFSTTIFCCSRSRAYGFLVRSSFTQVSHDVASRRFQLELRAEDAESLMDIDSLMDMDVVICTKKDETEKKNFLCALQEDGTLSPLSAWTDEPAFGTSLEFLVDENERFSLPKESVNVHCRVPEEKLSYGSRQCHRGVGNPHGEESELLYYVEESILEDFDIQVTLKPELEILW